jgi:uncharacterized membrane protein
VLPFTDVVGSFVVIRIVMAYFPDQEIEKKAAG